MRILSVLKKREKRDEPIKTLKNGAIEAAIWLNKRRGGKVNYRVSWSRPVTVGNGQVRYAKSLRPEDLPAMFDSLRDTMLYFIAEGHIKLSVAEELAWYHQLMSSFDTNSKDNNGLRPV